MLSRKQRSAQERAIQEYLEVNKWARVEVNDDKRSSVADPVDKSATLELTGMITVGRPHHELEEPPATHDKAKFWTELQDQERGKPDSKT